MQTKERRKYIRLNKIFPVELQVVDLHNKPLSGLLQGFTRDVSFEGVCIAINNFDHLHLEALLKQQAKVILFLNIPLKHESVRAVSSLIWMEKSDTPYEHSYHLGMKYEVIDKVEQRQIIRHACFTRRFPRVVAVCFIIFVLSSIYLLFENRRLLYDNKLLVKEITVFSHRQFEVQTALDKIEAEKIIVHKLLQNSSQELKNLKGQVILLDQSLRDKQLKDRTAVDLLINERRQLDRQLALLIKDKTKLEEKLKNYSENETELKTQLVDLKGKRMLLGSKSLQLMYKWLISAQSGKTGLVLSYEDDSSLIDVGFTYDQALSAFNFVYFEEYTRAEKIFDFFKTKAQRIEGGFANAYDVVNGSVNEYIVHSGPSSYLGLAMLYYEDKTGKGKYRSLACDIGDWVLTLQKESDQGGVCGGPGLTWSSTEQNLAAYVLFKNLAKRTQEQKYSRAAEKILVWLKDVAYNHKLKRFNRGASDGMIATDAIALSILALGPAGLSEIGIDVEDLIVCVEENCKIQVWVKDVFGKRQSVTGYDFCSPSSIGRRGLVSVEWTAQMVIAYKELSRYYLKENNDKKARRYMSKADYYLGELEKLLLVRSSGFGVSRSMAGLPYATDTGIDTGHGWNTPNSSSISAAGTNFVIFAKQEYNIFKL
ncbi:MAG: hypothetical protein GY853_03780 [PVC group bacterium]|nr:hypothetical protein [PVC group bacterium]